MTYKQTDTVHVNISTMQTDILLLNCNTRVIRAAPDPGRYTDTVWTARYMGY